MMKYIQAAPNSKHHRFKATPRYREFHEASDTHPEGETTAQTSAVARDPSNSNPGLRAEPQEARTPLTNIPGRVTGFKKDNKPHLMALERSTTLIWHAQRRC